MTVEGFCPMGCGETLVIYNGRLRCAEDSCPTSDAAHRILCDPQTEHVVTFTRFDFAIQHPLRERLDGALHNCMLHLYCNSLVGPPVAPGKYIVTAQDTPGGWMFDPVQA